MAGDRRNSNSRTRRASENNGLMSKYTAGFPVPPPKYLVQDQDIPCVLCESVFQPRPGNEDFLRHLALAHNLIIADVKLICDFYAYASYWKKRLREKELTDFCSVIKINSREDDVGEKENYYLLSDTLPEDKNFRRSLMQKQLEYVLECQRKERDDVNFSRFCFMCRQLCTENRSTLLAHLSNEHKINLGKPDNIVFIHELLDMLDEKVNNNQCIYCERVYTDRNSLKDHMRKRNHKKINPSNTAYDKFYIINYLELGKNWEQVQAEDDSEIVNENNTESDNEWDDWDENQMRAKCLFCDGIFYDLNSILDHMSEMHYFDMETMRKENKMGYYQQLKLINYVRKRLSELHCINCDADFDSRHSLTLHLAETRSHASAMPDSQVWNQPQYYFPVLEDDHLLCLLDDEFSSTSYSVTAPLTVVTVNENMVTKQQQQSTSSCGDGDGPSTSISRPSCSSISSLDNEVIQAVLAAGGPDEAGDYEPSKPDGSGEGEGVENKFIIDGIHPVYAEDLKFDPKDSILMQDSIRKFILA